MNFLLKKNTHVMRQDTCIQIVNKVLTQHSATTLIANNIT